MSRMLSSRRQAGFTLIEVLASITVFAIITIGLIPLLASTIRGSLLSRTFTSEKSLIQGAIEYVRGLPYFVTGTKRTDVLDLYFPDLNAGATVSTPEAGSVSTGYSSGSSTFTTACTATTKAPSASAPAACPHSLSNGASSIPTGTTVVYAAQFLDRNQAVYTPPAGYSYSTAQSAPSSLLRLTVTAYWKVGARKRQFSLTTLIGARKLNTETIRGEGRIDYMAQVITGYHDADGSQSDLTALLGSSDSLISTKAISTADQSVVAGKATLTQEDFGDTQGSTLSTMSGALSTLGAPPNSTAGPITNPGSTMASPAGLFATPMNLAGMSSNQVTAASAQVNNNLPQASGSFQFNNSGSDSFWVNNQNNPTSYLQLDPTQPMVDIDRGSSTRVSGSTSAVSTDVVPASSRKIESTAAGTMNKLSILPTGFICTGSNPDPSCSGGDRSVIVISNFQASLDCKSTASSSTAAATGSWSATLQYWDGTQKKYISVPLAGSVGSTATDPVTALKASNPLVFDSPDDTQDVHLFDTGTTKGYLKDLSDVVNIPATKDGTGANTSVTLNGAISVVTASTDPTVSGDNPTGINVTVGSMSCTAKDARG